MSLGHVYIVLEPVGSERLTLDDDRHYEFMCLDVRKIVYSPEYDHGHDEESRNGRDIKIDILEGYIRTSERFRVIWVFFFREPRGYWNPPGKCWAHMGLKGERGKPVGVGRMPPPRESE